MSTTTGVAVLSSWTDGRLWSEKAMPIQLDFIHRRPVEMAEAAGWTVVSIRNDWLTVFAGT
jgi:hypothetical protein